MIDSVKVKVIRSKRFHFNAVAAASPWIIFVDGVRRCVVEAGTSATIQVSKNSQSLQIGIGNREDSMSLEDCAIVSNGYDLPGNNVALMVGTRRWVWMDVFNLVWIPAIGRYALKVRQLADHYLQDKPTPAGA
jgi:hypothetical protein